MNRNYNYRENKNFSHFPSSHDLFILITLIRKRKKMKLKYEQKKIPYIENQNQEKMVKKF